jgi:type IV secretion system protein VirB9
MRPCTGAEITKYACVGGILALLVSGVPPARAFEYPKPGKEDTRVMFIEYAPYQVTRVAGGLRTSTQIEFAADEEIVHVSIGNAIAWEVAPAGNLLFVKAREHHPQTNMQVVTARNDGVRRSYQIELWPVPDADVKRLPPMLFVKFRYPSDEALRTRQDAAARAGEQRAGEVNRELAQSDVGLRNYAYSIQGDAPYEPVVVYDTGKTTTFEFRGNIEMPAIYLARADGSEELIPKTVNGNLVVVHAISPKFVLRRGDEVMCVFSERFLPQGIDHATKTMTPNVVRTVKTAPKTKVVHAATRSARSAAGAGGAVPLSAIADPAALPANPGNRQPL